MTEPERLSLAEWLVLCLVREEPTYGLVSSACWPATATRARSGRYRRPWSTAPCLHATTGFEHTLVVWRHEAMTATVRFLEALTAQSEVSAR